MNKWKEIWEKRTDRFSEIDMADEKAVFMELKRIDGFDVNGGGIAYDALIRQNTDIISNLSRVHSIQSLFDVGCGCGANLYICKKQGLKVGGMDYSEAQIAIAQKVLIDDAIEFVCGEAIELPTENKYDAVVSNSVFSYFPDDDYALKVLEKMMSKARYSVGLIDVHDIEKKEGFTAYRRKMIEGYDEKYEGLGKHFYAKSLFSEFADKNGWEIMFQESNVEGYWNNEFVFNCYLYRKD